MLKLPPNPPPTNSFVQLPGAFLQLASRQFGCDSLSVCIEKKLCSGALNSKQHAHLWIFLCGKSTVKAHLCTLLSSACQVVGQEYLGGTPCFCFSLQGGREEGVQDGRLLAQVTLWMMCMEHCLVQLSTLHSKRPFFNPGVSHLRAGTVLPLKPPPFPHPPPAPSCPASPGPGPSASCGWTGAGRRWNPGPVLRRDLFFSRTGTCWYWQGGAEGWRGSFISFIWGMVEIVPLERKK